MRHLSRWASILWKAGVFACLFFSSTHAHILAEEPWHPVPAAYLRSLFYANLKPIDWPLIAQEYSVVKDPGYEFTSIYEALAPAQSIAGIDHVRAIREAITQQDRQALYAASTRAVSQLIRYYLREAETKLKQPGIALEDVLKAQRIYRAFGPQFIRQTDADAFQRLGRAWLDLTSSVGNAGIRGIGSKAPDPAKYATARKIIEEYLIANYEREQFTSRAHLAPLPETSPTAYNKEHLSPWLPPGSDFNDQDPLPRLVLNFEARGFDEKDLFLVAYGDMLFDSPEIFGEPARSLGIACSTCHNRSDINQRFFIPGISHQPGAADVDGQFFNPRFNDQRKDPLDIPSLRGLRFTAPYGRDGRFASLRDFVRNVIVNEFAGAEPTPLMLDALVAYLFEFDWLPSPFLHPDGTLNDKASEAAKRGEVLFNTPFPGMGNRACSTCHIPSANFIDGLRHDIGSAHPASPGARDTFFDTPTLLNIRYTAPYFHDGSLETLADVVEWFNSRHNLGLSDTQKGDLVAYLDAVGTGEEPFEVFDEENTRFVLDFGELSTFISTLDTLIPLRDTYHIDLLLRTVAKDLRLDASGLLDRSQAPLVYTLADKLEAIHTAVTQDNWTQAAALWGEYKDLEAQYGPQFK